MKRVFSLIITILALHLSLDAQTITGASLNYSTDVNLNRVFNSYEVFVIDMDEVQRSLNSRGTRTIMHLQLGNHNWNLDLFEHDMFRSNFVQGIGTDHGIDRIKQKPSVRTYQGYNTTSKSARVGISFADNMIIGSIQDNGETYFIEPLKGYNQNTVRNAFVVYKESEVKANTNISCATEVESYNVSTPNTKSLQARAGCVETEIAMACDKTVHDARGGISGAQNWATSILNLVQTNYDNEFGTEIQFYISEIVVFPTAGSDPWNTVNNINTHLDVHRNQSSSIYTQGYDVATAWTRKYTSGAVGLAWVSAVCSSFRYNVCSDFNTSNNNLRNLQAHELGHNFSCLHDSGNGFIMSPSVNGSSTWSTASINSVNGFLPTAGCLGPCSNGSPPLANFKATPTTGCAPVVVTFSDLSAGTPTQWLWSFPGGTPATSTLQNPKVTYNTYGTYEVTLTVTNAFGSDTKTEVDYIQVDEKPVVNFNFDVFDFDVNFYNLSLFGNTYLWKFGDGTTSTEFEPMHTYSKDGTYEVTLKVTNSCGFKELKKTVTIVTPPTVDFKADTTYGCAGFSVKYTNLSSANTTKFFWEFPGGTPSTSSSKDVTVKYNGAGNFDSKLTGSNAKYSLLVSKKGYITVDTVPVGAFAERINVDSIFLTDKSLFGKTYLWDFGDGTTSTDINPIHKYAAFGEYLIILKVKNNCGTDIVQKKVIIGTAATAKFKVANQIGCVPYEVQFENQSLNATSFKWSFPGGNPSSSTEANPVVKYSKTGKYDVTLEASNPKDNNTIVSKEFITVIDIPKAGFTQAISKLTSFFTNTSEFGDTYSWDFGDNSPASNELSPSHTYNTEGEYKVVLTVTNKCGSQQFEKLVSIYLVPKVDFRAQSIKICAGDFTNFHDLSSNDVLNWNWQFDGGSPANSVEKNPQVRYDKAGKYGVKLTVENSNGTNFITKVAYIEVLTPVACPDKTKKKKRGNDDNNQDEYGSLDSRNNLNVDIVPNPNNGQFSIFGLPSSENLTVEIFNLVGVKVCQANEQQINAAALHAGSYIVRIKFDGQEQILRLIIQD